MTNEQFKLWRKKMKLSQRQAAEVLGLYRNTIVNYERGVRLENGMQVKIPRTVALACSAVEAGLEPWDK